MIKKFLLALVAVSVLLEGTLTSIPLVLMSLVLFVAFTKDTAVFFIACIAGILLDIFLIRGVGISSVFFLVVLFLVFMYERKFEIRSLLFVMSFSLVSSFVYLIIFSTTQLLLSLMAVALFSGVVFVGIKQLTLLLLKKEAVV